jgi:hypothetical protein
MIELGDNYIDRIASQVEALLPDCPKELLRIYALLILVKGTFVTAQDVHDAWSVWTAAVRPDHRSLVPFDELTPQVQELDEPPRRAIAQLAWHRS